jgi:aldehyde dehydrogenase (NAD+)
LLQEDHKGSIIHGGIQQGKLKPTILFNPSLNSRIMKEEIFGPILPVITFNHFSEVINIINSLDKPLVVYYYSKNHTGDNFKLLEE